MTVTKWVLAASLILWGCSKKNEPAPPPPKAPVPEAPIPAPETTAAPAPAAPTAAPLAFISKPVIKAWVRHPYLYRTQLNLPQGRLRLAKGPDSMRVQGGVVTWSPAAQGSYPVVLEAAAVNAAAAAAPGPGGDSLRARQSFSVIVGAILSPALKPLPAQVNKGDSVSFDLRATTYPEWAGPAIRVSFDFDGDGRWEETDLPFASASLHKHAYDHIGKFAPKVGLSVNGETYTLPGAVNVVSDVEASLKVSPDTAEPGAKITVDASASKSDGPLVFRLDFSGKPQALDSTASKWTLPAPPSGRYEAHLVAVNAMGREGKASASFSVNAAPHLELKVKNPKDHMAAAIEIRARGRDEDDSIQSLRINFTGEAGAWETKTKPDSAHDGHEWFVRFEHVYGKTGRFEPEVCLMAGDGRSICKKTPIEIFNAPPQCPPGADVHATLGKPVEIVGEGVDPDGKIVKWEWDLDGDGKYEVASKTDGKLHYTFGREGKFSLGLRVTTADGMTATAKRIVEVRKKWKS